MPEIHVNHIFSSLTYRTGNVIIDPGDPVNFEGVKTVLLTHAHFDHIYGLNELVRINPDVKVYTNAFGRKSLADSRKNMSFYQGDPFTFDFDEKMRTVEDGDTVDLTDGRVAKAYFTPGHNPACITWVIDDMVFTGDAFIPGVKTVTYLPWGDKKAVGDSEELIKRLLIGRKIMPGHDVNSDFVKDLQ